MANANLSYVHLSSQELEAFKNIVRLSFEAFEASDYPHYFDNFLLAILQIVNLGSAAFMRGFPSISYTEFSIEVDKLSSFLREVQSLVIKNEY